jgi:hypothetical protein
MVASLAVRDLAAELIGKGPSHFRSVVGLLTSAVLTVATVVARQVQGTRSNPLNRREAE